MNKKILVGISGGIAAYKATILIRRLKEKGYRVKVVMTESAQAFITPLTLQAVSSDEVRTDLLNSDAESGMDHIELARWADLIVIAPATANTIAKIVHGFADNLLTTLCLATNSKIMLVPAMNQQMWNNLITQENINKAIHKGFLLAGPDIGNQACGENGYGRMLEPEQIVDEVEQFFAPKESLGISMLITAGPTFEAIDPVRGITNHSSGTMGYALAKAATDIGINVTLVSGPVNQTTPHNVKRVDVLSAQQMYDEVHAQIKNQDIFIAVAAVADYRPITISEHKIKKSQQQEMVIHLAKNPDILASVGSLTKHRPFCVGFAAETQNVTDNAKQKLVNKNIDMIIANEVGSELGFGNVLHHVNILSSDEADIIPLGPLDKGILAKEIIKHIVMQYSKVKVPIKN